MAPRHSTVAQAYSVLGLEEGVGLEEVKSVYKQLALKTHPDKNPDNPDATEQFQKLSEAYNVLVRHLDTSTRPAPRGPAFSPFGFGGGYSRDYDDLDDIDDDDDYYYDDDDDYDEEDYENDDMDFFRFLFEEVLHGRASRFSHANFRRAPREAESPEEYHARIRKSREDQIAAEKRRAQENEERKERERREREQERQQAEKRQREKVQKKKAEAAESKKSAAAGALAQQRRTQSNRSAVFAAARQGDMARVKKGIWEDNVDAAGGEIRPGGEPFVDCPPNDPAETLLHIAARRGDAELVKWLDSHNAEAEERDSDGLSAFHLAARHGHVPVMKHFIETYDPADDDHDQIYSLSDSEFDSVIRLALDSGVPEAVWVVLENKLSTDRQTRDAWSWSSSPEGKQAIMKSGPPKTAEARYEEIMNLLMSYGHFTPPPTPKGGFQPQAMSRSQPRGTAPSPSPLPAQTVPAEYTLPPRGHQTKHSQVKIPQQQPTPPSQSPVDRPPSHASFANGFNGRGRGRGRGRARGRGRGRGGPP